MDCISIDKVYKLVLNSQWKQTALRPVMLQKRWEGILGSTNCFVYLSSGGLTDEGEGWVENNSLLLSLRPSR